MTFAPDGRIFYTEKSGAVRVVKNGAILPTRSCACRSTGTSSRGLECITLDPNFATNGFFYLYYTRRDPDNPNTVPEQRQEPHQPVPGRPRQPRRALAGSRSRRARQHPRRHRLPQRRGDGLRRRRLHVRRHRRGRPAQHPATPPRAQDLSTLAGKILRINPRAARSSSPATTRSSARPASAARSTPTASATRSRCASSPAPTSIYANDVGSWQAEEINEVKKGANYGFPDSEGYTTNRAYTNPVYAYTHASTGNANGQAAITGGTFYTGNKFPVVVRGQILLRRLRQQASSACSTRPCRGRRRRSRPTPTRCIDLDVGPDGNLYGLSHTVGTTNAQIVQDQLRRHAANRAPTAVSDGRQDQRPAAADRQLHRRRQQRPRRRRAHLLLELRRRHDRHRQERQPHVHHQGHLQRRADRQRRPGRHRHVARRSSSRPGNDAPVDHVHLAGERLALLGRPARSTSPASATDAEDGTLAGVEVRLDDRPPPPDARAPVPRRHRRRRERLVHHPASTSRSTPSSSSAST